MTTDGLVLMSLRAQRSNLPSPGLRLLPLPPQGQACCAPRNDIKMRRSGFTLAEAMMAMVLLGLAAAGVLLPFSSGAAVQAEGLRVTLAAKLADDLLERIIATPFQEITALGDGYTSTEPQGQIADALGVDFTDPMYANFSRDVTYRYAYLAGYTPTPDFVLVTVRVRYQGREIATLSRLIGK
jgi:prepilin-type N-terminal cleavage/methylation domain-containing protein